LKEKAAESRNGLHNMRKRMQDIGGDFSIGPGEHGGTLVRLTIPLGAPLDWHRDHPDKSLKSEN
jgi:signal transduction histidine kinase